jgi:small subunit ribosomal protein S17
MSKKIIKSMSGTVKAASKTAIAPLKKASELKGTRTGVVESDKRSKTRTVVVAFQTMHPKYGKYMKNRTVLHVHDEKNESRTGDVVEVAQCRPISKTKQWRLVKVVENRAELAAAIASVKDVQ